MLSFVIGTFALIVALTAFIITFGDDDQSGAASPEPVSTETEFEVELTEFAVSPATINVPVGQVVTFRVTNNGTMPHDLKFGGTVGTQFLLPGSSQKIEIGPFDEPTEAWCTVPGHKEAGMLMRVNVIGADGQPVGGGTDSGAAGGSDSNGDASENATIDAQAVPADDWQARLRARAGTDRDGARGHAERDRGRARGGTGCHAGDVDVQRPSPRTDPARPGRRHVHDHAGERRQVRPLDRLPRQQGAPGTTRCARSSPANRSSTSSRPSTPAYGCTTAAPRRPCTTSATACTGPSSSIRPTLHRSTTSTSSSSPSSTSAPRASRATLRRCSDEDFDAVVFNGYVTSTARPIRVEPGRAVPPGCWTPGRARTPPFHIVGTIFDTVFKEGAYLLQPDDTPGGSQALDLQPAQGGFVEFTFDEDGLYPIVTHKFANAGKGALGFFAVGDADTSALGGH